MSDRYSPLHDVHVAAGASFTDFAGWQMPVRYTSDLAEHRAVRTAAGLFDLSHMGEIVLVGPEAGAALDYALAGSLSGIPIGRAKYSLLLSPSGGVVDDLVVYRTGEDRFLIVANASNREVVADALRSRANHFETEVYDESDDLALIAVQGPGALEILLATDGFSLDGGHPDGEDVPAALTALGYYRVVPGAFRDHEVLIARTGYTGEDGFELFCSPEAAPVLWEALTETGSPLGLIPCGLASRDTLRLEAGMPLYGHELSLDVLPAQAGLGRVVDLSKAVDFVGRDASELGPAPDAPVLVGLRGSGKRAARADYPVLDADGVGAAGIVTSGALSPTLEYPIAMAYVRPVLAQPGTELAVDVRGTPQPYTVVPVPFYTREKN